MNHPLLILKKAAFYRAAFFIASISSFYFVCYNYLCVIIRCMTTVVTMSFRYEKKRSVD